MKPKFKEVLELAISQGVQYGYNRAYKHNDDPSDGAVVDSIVEQVLNSIDEWFDFDGGFE